MHEDKNKILKRLVMDIDVNFHAEIKMRAARLNLPMRVWVKRAIAEAIKKEEKYNATERNT